MQEDAALPTVYFCVPTGNFGNALAGFYARSMGLPVERLVVATNHNDIIYRFMEKGDYTAQAVRPSLGERNVALAFVAIGLVSFGLLTEFTCVVILIASLHFDNACPISFTIQHLQWTLWCRPILNGSFSCSSATTRSVSKVSRLVDLQSCGVVDLRLTQKRPARESV